MDTVDDFISGYCSALEKTVLIEKDVEYIDVIDITNEDEKDV